MHTFRITKRLAISILSIGALFGVAPDAARAAEGCRLTDGVTHVVHLQFDNVHLRRDNPNVPSDLELMPNLLGFLLANGTVSGNHYTPLISHTATDILTALTGLYGDRMGVPVSNSYRVFDASGHVSTSHPSFLYWTAADATDGKPLMLTENGKIAPAPWVPFTRAGCDVGAFSVANIEFENVLPDLATVYGPTSPELAAAQADFASSDPARKARPNAQWLGVAIHCAKGGALCAKGKPDALRDEPDGYDGFNALYGNVNVQPAISPSGPVEDLNGNVIQDSRGNPGFPNLFNPLPEQTLGYLATMLEAGVPVVYGYIADAHDNRSGPGAFGPGEAGYVAQLKSYDQAFGKFFARLAQRGITPANTLFIVSADENDHFVGGTPSPANCDGVSIPCVYVYADGVTRSVGELTANLDSLLYSHTGRKPADFLVHSDDAPTIYIEGNPAPTDAITRLLEKDVASLTWINPLPGKNNETDKLAPYLADRAEMKLLRMITASAARSPSFTLFGHPDYFFQTSKGSLPLAPVNDCAVKPTDCVFQNNGFAWNHGDVQQDITRTWFGMAGPGVKKTGRDDRVFSDHTDLRPTMLALLGLSDDYAQDGRVLVEKIESAALPRSIGSRHRRDWEEDGAYVALARVYKQLYAPLGSVGRNSLKFASRAIEGDDAAYADYLQTIEAFTTRRDAVAAEIRAALNDAAFHNVPLSESHAERLVGRAHELIEKMKKLANGDDAARSER